MKQPEQKVILTDDGGDQHVCMVFGAGCIDLSYAKNERKTMERAIRRLSKLQSDAAKMLEKLE